MIRSPTYKYFRKRPSLGEGLTIRTAFKNIQLNVALGRSSSEHIFVVGPPRNGTTLIQKLLANHPMMAGADAETFFFLKRRLDTLNVPEIPSERMRELFRASKTSAEYFDRMARAFTNNTKRFIEKSPEHALVMPRVLKLFPRSKIIFIYRDGRDAYISALKHAGVRAKLGRNYPYLWRDSMLALERIRRDTRVRSVRYEGLCEDPNTVLSEVFDHCNLEFSRELADPSSYSQTRYAEKSEHERLKENISAKTVGIHTLPENTQDTAYFESVSGDVLKRFGYVN